MGAILLDGETVAARIRAEVADGVARLRSEGIHVGLGTILVGGALAVVVGALAGLLHCDLGRHHARLLAGADADRLPAGDDRDRVGRGAAADAPGQDPVAPFVLGRGTAGDRPPLRAWRVLPPSRLP